jgi:probable phosphoglycerate mutase
MLYFLRHGQTAYSKTGGYCGTPENDPGLTAEGIEMAEEFADVYRSLPWRAAYVTAARCPTCCNGRVEPAFNPSWE